MIRRFCQSLVVVSALGALLLVSSPRLRTELRAANDTTFNAINAYILNGTPLVYSSNLNGGPSLITVAATCQGAVWGTSPAIVGSNGTLDIRINVGTGGTGTDGCILMPVPAPNFWNCTCQNMTSNTACRQLVNGNGATGVGGIPATTTVVILSASAFTAGDTIDVKCVPM